MPVAPARLFEPPRLPISIELPPLGQKKSPLPLA